MKKFLCSEHMIERSVERYGLDREAAQKYADRAIRNGRSEEDYSGKARRYLEKIRCRHDAEHTLLRIHGNNCFVLSDAGTVITTYPLGEAFYRLNRPKMPRFSDDDSFAIADPYFFQFCFVPNVVCFCA